MPDLSDLQLDKEVGAAAEQTSHRRRVLLIVLLAGLVAGGAYLFFTLRSRSPSNVQLRTDRAVVPSDGAAKRAAPGDNILLPPLDQTDSLVRELVSRLSSHPKVAAWLTTDQLIRNLTVSLVNVADGQSPSRHLQRVAPRGAFAATTRGDTSVIDPRSYQRYDEYADAVAALDAGGVARLYQTLKPRIQEAARELGEPDADFDRTVQRAIDELLRTPVVDGPIQVVPAPVVWKYADPRLESLSAAQRQLLRMGPRNVRIVQAKLREIAGHLFGK